MSTDNQREVMDRNREAYALNYHRMQWLSPQKACEALAHRQMLLDAILKHSVAGWSFARTKLHTHALSPGCRLCGQGTWSCLFINGTCNASCFYCPAPQNDPGPPMTNRLTFDDPEDYASYVEQFGFRGVAFSGGEPLLAFDRVCAYLAALRRRLGSKLTIWMYTNGLLATGEKLRTLRDLGLDEIRFDLGANAYKTETMELALGIIPRVTVEIPAVPEDLPVTRPLLARLATMGVDHLNLHQVRCTKHNCQQLMARGYTFLHGPGVTVLETEWAALELMAHALKKEIDLPINYCSFTYRHQFQAAGARQRAAQKICQGQEEITPAGYIRSLCIRGSQKAIDALARRLETDRTVVDGYRIDADGQSLHLIAYLWPRIDFSQVQLEVAYRQAVVLPAVSYRHAFTPVQLESGQEVVVEKQTLGPPRSVNRKQAAALGRWLNALQEKGNGISQIATGADLPADLRPFETVTPGLAEYF